jgi:hypothetical protein
MSDVIGLMSPIASHAEEIRLWITLCGPIIPWPEGLRPDPSRGPRQPLLQMYVDAAFTGTGGLSLGAGSPLPIGEASVKAAMMAADRRSILLADYTKVGNDSLARSESLADVDLLVTDAGLDDGAAAAIGLAGPRVLASQRRGGRCDRADRTQCFSRPDDSRDDNDDGQRHTTPRFGHPDSTWVGAKDRAHHRSDAENAEQQWPPCTGRATA